VRTPAVWYPRDGRTADALMARTNDLLGGRRDPERTPVSAGLAAISPAMARIHGLVERTAASTINVLIMGETGVGKDVVARVIHRRSLRAQRPFLALNCAGLSEALIESELFGHEKGAFTGASQLKLGLLETAEGGTVFLDEVGELPFNMQAKLLRVIEMREVQRVGALKPRPIDVRFVAATNRDLEAEVLQGRFRRDLFFRLNGISLTIPPLRDRVGEIRLLARNFIQEACAEIGRPVPLIDEEVFTILEGYSWPGNIRELKNYMDRALVLCEDELLPEHLPLEKITQGGLALPVRVVLDVPPPSHPSQEAERRRMIDALTAAGGNQTRAAESLGMPRRTFVSKLDRYGFPRPRKRETPPASMPAIETQVAAPADEPGKQK
jgi:DNA-binding NtrC family response regulator